MDGKGLDPPVGPRRIFQVHQRNQRSRPGQRPPYGRTADHGSQKEGEKVMAKKTGDQESKTYQAMLDEVETIVRDIGDGEVDLDAMVEKIEHGYGLIKTMRERLDKTREKVEKLREEFTTEESILPVKEMFKSDLNWAFLSHNSFKHSQTKTAF